MSKHLIEQPTSKPVRKVRVGAYALAALTVATYIFGAVQGQEVIDAEAAGGALAVLTSGLVPLLSAWLAKSEAADA